MNSNDDTGRSNENKQVNITYLYIIVNDPTQQKSNLFDAALVTKQIREDIVNYLHYN